MGCNCIATTSRARQAQAFEDIYTGLLDGGIRKAQSIMRAWSITKGVLTGNIGSTVGGIIGGDIGATIGGKVQDIGVATQAGAQVATSAASSGIVGLGAIAYAYFLEFTLGALFKNIAAKEAAQEVYAEMQRRTTALLSSCTWREQFPRSGWFVVAGGPLPVGSYVKTCPGGKVSLGPSVKEEIPAVFRCGLVIPNLPHIYRTQEQAMYHAGALLPTSQELKGMLPAGWAPPVTYKKPTLAENAAGMAIVGAFARADMSTAQKAGEQARRAGLRAEGERNAAAMAAGGKYLNPDFGLIAKNRAAREAIGAPVLDLATGKPIDPARMIYNPFTHGRLPALGTPERDAWNAKHDGRTDLRDAAGGKPERFNVAVASHSGRQPAPLERGAGPVTLERRDQGRTFVVSQHGNWGPDTPATTPVVPDELPSDDELEELIRKARARDAELTGAIATARDDAGRPAPILEAARIAGNTPATGGGGFDLPPDDDGGDDGGGGRGGFPGGIAIVAVAIALLLVARQN